MLPALVVVVIAVIILFISILKSASREVKFYSATDAQPEEIRDYLESNIDYEFTNPGSVLPGNLLWPVKAIRDRVWLIMTPDMHQKTELYLLFADKRLGAGVVLFERGEYELGFYSLQKSAQYISLASETEKRLRQDTNTEDLLLSLYAVSKGHYETINDLVVIAPEDAKPEIIKVQDTSKMIFESSMHSLIETGHAPMEMNLGI